MSIRTLIEANKIDASRLKVTKAQFRDIYDFVTAGVVPQNLSPSQQSRFRRNFGDYRADAKKGQVYDPAGKQLVFQEEIRPLLNRLYNDPATGFIGRDKLYVRVGRSTLVCQRETSSHSWLIKRRIRFMRVLHRLIGCCANHQSASR